MARQAGPLFITGTVDDMVFYQMNGIYYMRRKGEPTSTTKKRMSQKEHYPVLCMRKREFKQASQMVREWYYTLPREVRKHGVFGKLTGKAVRMLRKGMAEEKIKVLLLQEMLQSKEVVSLTDPTQATENLKVVAPAQPVTESNASLGGSAWQVNEKGRLYNEQALYDATINVANNLLEPNLQKGYCWPVAFHVSSILAKYASG